MTPTQALAAALAVEHQVIYGYGVAGAHLSAAGRTEALRELDAHHMRRDRIAALLSSARAAVPVAAPAYALPFPVIDDVSARALCSRLETGCSGAAWDVVASTPAASMARDLGVTWLEQSAIAAARWSGVTPGPALPGQPR